MRNRIWGKSPRTALIQKNIAASLLIKGWSTIVLFALVPLTLKCLGTYENGVWLTISSMLVWVDNLDIGLGNGLRNKLAESLAQNDIDGARKAVSSTFIMLIIVILPACVIINILIWKTDIYAFFNVDPDIINNLRAVVTTAITVICTTFIFKFIGNFFMGLQLPAINNFMVTAGQTLMLLGTAALYYSDIHSLLAITLVNTASPLIVYLASWGLTFYGKYKYISPSLRYLKWNTVTELFSMGIKFFILQLAGMVLFMSTNIIISNVFTPELVTPFQISYRYFSVAQLLFNIICMPYWTATTDAYRRGDIQWIRHSDITLNKYLIVIIVLIAALLFASKFIFSIWIGTNVYIPIKMKILVALYILTMLISIRYSYIINGIGTLKLQLITTTGAAAIYIPLAIGVSRVYGSIYSLLIVMWLINVPGLIINIKQYYKILSGKAHGIWLE